MHIYGAVVGAVSQYGVREEDPLDWVTAGGQDMTYSYTPTETAGSTVPLCSARLHSVLSKSHSSAGCFCFLHQLCFSHCPGYLFPPLNPVLPTDSISRAFIEKRQWQKCYFLPYVASFLWMVTLCLLINTVFFPKGAASVEALSLRFRVVPLVSTSTNQKKGQ